MPTMKQFTARYGVRANTIRRWTNTYAEYFSDDANPPKGKRRRYTVEDADVIDLIATMREEDAEPGEILNALKTGKRGSWPRDDYETAQNGPGATEIPLTEKDKLIAELSRQAGYLEAVIDERDYLRGQVGQLQDQVGDLKDQLRLLAAPTEPPPDSDETPATDDTETPEETPPAKLTRRQRLANWIGGG